MRRLLLRLILIAGIALPGAGRAVDVLANLRPGHPRLLVTDDALAAILERARTDPVQAQVNGLIIAAAERLLASKPVTHTLIGPRMLDQSRAAIGLIVTEAFAYRLTHDPRFLKRAVADLQTVSAFDDWNPSHFLDVAEMGTAVAIGYDWLYNDLTAAERATFEQALLTKALCFAPVAYGPAPHSDKRLFFVTARMNWNQVCNGGLLMAALALADRDPDTARTVIVGARRSLPLALAAYEPDGGFPEGPGYWEYGTMYTVVAVAGLQSALGTDFGLSQAPGFKKTALYRLAVVGPTGLAFNYADGHETLEHSPALDWLCTHVADPAIATRIRSLDEREVALMGSKSRPDRFFALMGAWLPPAASRDAGSPPRALHFRGAADIALMRSDWDDPNGLFVGFKAGDNAANHSHLDLGSFVLDDDGVRWAEDLGPDDYNLPGYFSGNQRWTYFRLNNLSHNTLTPGGQLQAARAVAPIIRFSAGPTPFAVADLSAVYPGSAGSLQRGIRVGASSVTVQDEITKPQVGLGYQWTLLTQADVFIASPGRVVTLTSKGKTLYARIIEPADAHWAVRMAKTKNAKENTNPGARLLSFEATAKPGTDTLRLVVSIDHGDPSVTGTPAALAAWK